MYRAAAIGSKLRRRRFVVALSLATTLAACANLLPSEPPATTRVEAQVAAKFEQLRGDPLSLRAFLRGMPKGAELHNHVSASPYAETYLNIAIKDDLCISKVDYLISPPPCDPSKGFVPTKRLATQNDLYNAAIDAYSMRNFVPGKQSGHDHFFASFYRYDLVPSRHPGEMLAEARRLAALDHLNYVEYMWSTFGMSDASALGRKVGWSDDFDKLRRSLIAAGIRNIIPQMMSYIRNAELRSRQILGCDSQNIPACQVAVKFIAQVGRTEDPVEVFAQCLLAFELVSREPEFVGVNLVAPEDDPVALRDYTLQMEMLAFLGKNYPDVKISLHAGELVPGLVPPEALRFHIRDAVQIAGAKRIGHGVDIFEEEDPAGLLRDMATKKILVEINLTSNDVILGVKGRQHPLWAYLRAGVPVALSTDDEGTNRTDLTGEFVRAALEQHLGYSELKKIARNSLEFSFLPGSSLWVTGDFGRVTSACATDFPRRNPVSSACAEYLGHSEKATQQWLLETQLTDFESRQIASN